MEAVIVQAREELKGLSKENGLKTIEVRKLSARLFKQIKSRDINEILYLCERLLEEREWAFGVIAYDWAYRIRKNYNDTIFSIFESWLFKYVSGWGDCDDFCTHAFGELLSQHPEYFNNILEWTSKSEFWVRRAAAVILILPIVSDRYKELNVFEISDRLMHDDNNLVLKGYGWMLKIYSTKEKEKIIQYLSHNQKVMPRVSFRYALEKLEQEDRQKLLKNNS